MSKLSQLLPLSIIAGSLALSACGGSSSGTGSLNLNITDAPVDDAKHVMVSFSGVSIKPENGAAYDIDFVDENNQPVVKQIDLFALQGMSSEALLHNHALEVGRYNWIRLHVLSSETSMDSYIELKSDSSRHPLYVPSGNETGLKINRPFEIVEGAPVSYTIDFDLRKSVTGPGKGKMSGAYMLRPTLRMVNNASMGHISGHVGDATINDSSCINKYDYAVYAFTGDNITPDDLDGNDPDPVTTSQLTDTYNYSLGYLEPGTYTLAFTCEAADDIVDSDDAINFIGVDTVTVTAGSIQQYNFN